MERPERASASVVAAGAVAILGGILAAASFLSSIVFLSVSWPTPQARPIGPELRPILDGLAIFLLSCALFTAFAGIQVIRLRQWARIAMLVIAGCMLFFAVVGVGVILVTIFVAPADPVLSQPLSVFLLVLIYGMPMAIATWWLVLFTKPQVLVQFERAAPQISGSCPRPTFFNNPRCPLAVRIVAWYLASFVLLVPFLPFLPLHIPAFFLGHLFRGPAAALMLILDFALLAVAGLGLLLVKRWGYAVTLASQILFCINGLYAAFSASFESVVRSVMDEMNLPALPPVTQAMFRQIRYFSLLGLIIPLAIIVTLLVCRRAFFTAANGAAPWNSHSQNQQ
jgi:hypothetical protein